MPQNVTDGKPKIQYPFAHAVIMPAVPPANLAHGNANVNYSGYETKRFGSCVIQTFVDGYSIVMAMGNNVTAKWTDLTVSGAADIVVSDIDSPKGSSFSDAKPRINMPMLGALDFPVVTKAALADGNHVINQNSISGKRIGACVVMQDGDDYVLCVAEASYATARWFPAYGAAITPSAETAVTGPMDKKPKTLNSLISAVPFPVVKAADLAKATHPVNAGDGLNLNGKRATAIVGSVAADGVVTLMMAVGAKPVDKWYKFTGDNTGAVTPA